MPGIEDVQPKQLSSLGQPFVTDLTPAVTQDAVQKLVEGFRSGYITTQDIMSRASTLSATKSRAELQMAREIISPEAIQARKEAQMLEAEKARGEREVGLAKDFVGAYLRYNLPLKKADGSTDYTGMAEVGQKYADNERLLKYAELGTKGEPRQFIDDKGRTHTVMINSFGEDITPVPGKKNAILENYQKMAQKARTFLLQNDDEPEVPEGGTAPVIEVAPKIMTPGPSPMITALAPQPFQYVPEGAVQGAPTPIAAAAPMVQPAQPVAAAPVVAPKVAPGVPEYEPFTGMITATTFKPDDYMKDVRGSELYKNWAEKTPAIAGFRATVRAYQAAPGAQITTQNDIDLANAALQIASPGATAGGRGMESYRVTRIEEAVPLLERLLDLPDVVLKRNKFPEETRNRIIEITERKAQQLEGLARDTLTSAKARLAEQGADSESVFFGPEKDLLGGAQSSASGAGTVTVPITLGSRKFNMTVRKQ
jgi:hypothetical protein